MEIYLLNIMLGIQSWDGSLELREPLFPIQSLIS